MRTLAILGVALLSACTETQVNPPAVYGARVAAVPASGASSTARSALVLPLEVNMATAETFVRLAYGLDHQLGFESTLFLTPRLRVAQAERLVRMVGDYNNFNGPKVADALLRLRGRVSSVEFGREGSPVIYIELPYWTHQREEATGPGQGTRISDSDSAVLAAEIKQLFQGLEADEISIENRRLRIWWD